MKKSGIIGGIVVALVLIFGLIAAITCFGEGADRLCWSCL